MRNNGPLDSAAGLGTSDHACWAYHEDDGHLVPGLEFLDDGLRNGARVAYSADKPMEELRADVAPLEDVDALLERGALQLFELDSLYGVGKPVDAAGQLATYQAALEDALACGHAGLRVLAEGTTMVENPDMWDAHLRWETCIDSYMSGRPLAAMCCYDARKVDPQIMGDVACAHPLGGGEAGLAPFRLFGNDGSLGVAGEIDAFSVEGFRRLLSLAAVPGEDLALDLTELGFIDHRGVSAIFEQARRTAARGRRLSVREAPLVYERICELIGV
ncbi:MAG: MEDS domain-containing protein [Thermoleophilaceae bacterium]|nr:MEDS domain-containing protein [Thermoleophilaceae bacterium]